MGSNFRLRVALCGIGIQAYWEQFSNLRPELEDYVRTMAAGLSRPGIELLELGSGGYSQSCSRGRTSVPVSGCRSALPLRRDPCTIQHGVASGAKGRRSDDCVNLQPEAAIDYRAFNGLPDRRAMTGAKLAYCSACPVPEIANVLKRARIPFHQVTGVLDENHAWTQIGDWLAAAQVKSALAETSLGLLGHSGMLDVSTDVTQICITNQTADSRLIQRFLKRHNVCYP
jgi:L-arabinose isomerase